MCPDVVPPEPEVIYCRECGQECVVNDDGTANHVFDLGHDFEGSVDHMADAHHVPIPDNRETL
jgi:hypothetical protein